MAGDSTSQNSKGRSLTASQTGQNSGQNLAAGNGNKGQGNVSRLVNRSNLTGKGSHGDCLSPPSFNNGGSGGVGGGGGGGIHHSNQLKRIPPQGTNVSSSGGDSGANSVNNSPIATSNGNLGGGGGGGHNSSAHSDSSINKPPGLGRSHSRSLTQTLGYNLQHYNNSQYLAQERVYLRKIKNELADDYYTKGITGKDDEDNDGNINDEDDEDEDEGSANGSNFLADIDDDKYQIDFNLAFSLLKDGRNKLNINFDKNVAQLSRDNAEDPAVVERLEWQSMLTSVLTGDVVKSEKTKIINNNSSESGQESLLHAAYKDNLWFGIRAKLFNRSEEDQRKIIAYRRTLADNVLQSVLDYEISYDDPVKNPPRKQVTTLLDSYYKCCESWRTLEVMRNEKPICRSPEFQERIDALNAWLSITNAIKSESASMRVWIGNDELDITKSAVSVDSVSTSSSTSLSVKAVKKIFDEDNKSLAERLMKEKDMYSIFQKRIFSPLIPWMIKAKDAYIRLGHAFEALKLPDYIHDLIQLCLIPLKLIKEIIKVRLLYAKKLQNPTLMMIDQMIDDLKSYITIALGIKLGIVEYCKPNPEKTWMVSDLFNVEYLDFDRVVLECVRYCFHLLNKKLLDGARSTTSFRTFKEPDELEETWSHLKYLGNSVEGGSIVVAQNITLLALKLTHRLLAYYNNQIRYPLDQIANVSDIIRWYSSTAEDFGQLRRKLARFTTEISKQFSNCLAFDIPSAPNNGMKVLLEAFRDAGFFLVYTGTVEAQGTYFFASPDLMDNESEILKIINGSYIGLDPDESNLEFSELLKLLRSEEEKNTSIEDDVDNSFTKSDFEVPLVLALCPPKPIVWEGSVVNIETDDTSIIDVKVGQMLMITNLPNYNLHLARERFLNLTLSFILSNGILKPIEQRCSLSSIHLELKKINRVFFRITLSVLDSVQLVISKCKELAPDGGYQELINNFFIYARDYGKNTLKILDSTKKSTVIMKLIQLSIDWVSFICDDCIPTDRKTFRWCVLALEFAMDMTRGFNVLVLNEKQFYRLKLKVARCMSLLISHFDIMGARSSEAEKKKLLKYSSIRHRIENSDDDEYILQTYREDLMKELDLIDDNRRENLEQVRSIGRVLDVSDLEYQFVTFLASSFSSVSIRWQKGKFIGGGSFGHVYAAVNLDTGGIMAVKEIRFYDSQSIKNIVPAIKDEMTILEMLNHPNIVQYYGVEVHREKVYIFMEFCEGGSLAGLLTHGRIEDEMVIQVYTLQMLEGLAYLHQSGVAHRDIKPENILLDHNGVIKFVDFGAAKVIATSGRTIGPATGSISGGMNKGNLNSMTGTPMYMSPEVITGSSSDKNGVVDIWSLGCCVLEMATGRRPWANLDNEWAIMYHIAAGHKPQLPAPEQLSEPGRKFLARCLEHDPKKRPSAVELLSDPWIMAIHHAAFGSDTSTPSSEVCSDV